MIKDNKINLKERPVPQHTGRKKDNNKFLNTGICRFQPQLTCNDKMASFLENQLMKIKSLFVRKSHFYYCENPVL